MQDIVFSFDLLTLALLFCLVFPIYWWILRKQVYFWFDPLLVFVFFNSISIAFVIYLYFFMHTIKLEYFISFSTCILGFIAGVLFGGRRGIPDWKHDRLKEETTAGSSNKYSLLVDVFMIICLLIMFFSNALMLIVKGTLPIFSENPSEAKIILYTGGWGIVRRINFALVNYVLAIPLIKLFHPSIKVTQKKAFFYLFCLLLCVLILMTMGSKSTLLNILSLLFGVLLINRSFGVSINQRLNSVLNTTLILKYAKYTFFFAVLFMVLVLVLSGAQTSTGDSLITRLVASGDVFYFFYVFDLSPSFHKMPLDYIPHILNPILGMFRLADYEFSVGVYTLYYAIGLPMDALAVFGPNAQHPIEGLVYFGIFGAPFYSFFIGYVVSFARIGMLRILGPFPNWFGLVSYLILSSIILTGATDFPLLMQILYDELIYGAIVLIVAALFSGLIIKR